MSDEINETQIIPPDDIIESESLNPRSYFNAAVLAIRQKAYKANNVDWDLILSNTHERVQASHSVGDIHPLIRYVLRALGDDHSHLITPSYGEDIAPEDAPDFGAYITPQGYAYVNVPSCGPAEDLGQSYANRIHENIKRLDEIAHPTGWIVDMRKNYGGNMWPMIAGLGPLLGNGEHGSFIDSSGKKDSITYINGEARYNDEVLNQIDEPYSIEGQPPAIAVLTSKDTASAGEIALIALLGHENVKVFGEATCGVPTANAGISLADGSTLLVTTSITADRRGRTYSSRIHPDVEAEIDWENIGNEKDPTLVAATDWLSSIKTSESF